jgi:branched-chain amino acid transport system ATP-binding protein
VSEPILRVSGLRRVFAGVAAIDGVTLTLAAGERHALIGPNGAGKTTLLNLIAGTVRADAGTVCWHGVDITRRGPAHRARAGIARTFQAPTVVPTLSTRDNLVLGAWPHVRRPRYGQLRARATDHLRRLGLADQAETPAAALSHGQRRLLDIGVALAGGPRLLLLDEPAAGLDGGGDLDRLLCLLAELPAGMTVLLVEHHLDVVAAVASTVTLLDRGRVVVDPGGWPRAAR